MSRDFRFVPFQAQASVVGLWGISAVASGLAVGTAGPFRPRTGGPCSCTLTGRTGLRPRLSLSRCTHTGTLHPRVPCTCNLRHCVGAEVPRAVGRGNCHLGEGFAFQRGYFSPPCEGLDMSGVVSLVQPRLCVITRGRAEGGHPGPCLSCHPCLCACAPPVTV